MNILQESCERDSDSTQVLDSVLTKSVSSNSRPSSSKSKVDHYNHSYEGDSAKGSNPAVSPFSTASSSTLQSFDNDIQDYPLNSSVSVPERSIVTPFLTTHINDQSKIPHNNYHKYCYRHNPDIKCNKLTDENKMKQIQKNLERLPSRDQEAISHVWSIFSAAPNQHRTLILQGLLSQCCFPQLSFISQEVSHLIRIDFISTLPSEISLKILCYLDCNSLCNAAQVSKNWKSLADDDRVWHHMCEQHIDRKCPNCGWGLPLMHMKRVREDMENSNDNYKTENNENDNSNDNNNDGNNTNNNNNNNNNINTVAIITNNEVNDNENRIQRNENYSNHNDQSNTSSSVNSSTNTNNTTAINANDNNNICNNDNEIQVRYNSNTNQIVDASTASQKNTHDDSDEDRAAKRRLIRKRPWKSVYSERFTVEKNWRKGIFSVKNFNDHTDGVTCLQFNHLYLMTGSYDSTIKIWNVKTGELIRTLTGHTKGVRTLTFDSQKLITGSLDATIKVWNYHTGQCISTYRGHEDAVVSVDFFNKTIVSGSADHTVKVWHVDSRTCYTLRGHTDWVNSVKIHPISNTLFSASDDTTIKMWDLQSNKCLRTFHGHVGQVQCIVPLIYKDKLIDSDSEVDTYEDRRFQNPNDERFNAHTQNQNHDGTLADNDAHNGNLDANGREREDVPETEELPENPNYPTHLLSSALDNTIKLWDVKTGKCVRTQFGHLEGVWSVGADTFRIISGAHDRLIKVWDLQNGKCLHTFGVDSSVSCVGLSDSRFCAGLENGEVKMYCFD